MGYFTRLYTWATDKMGRSVLPLVIAACSVCILGSVRLYIVYNLNTSLGARPTVSRVASPYIYNTDNRGNHLTKNAPTARIAEDQVPSRSIWKYYQSPTMYQLKETDPSMGLPDNWTAIPRRVIYVWCDPSEISSTSRRHFTFKHYLAVKSVLKYLNPDQVMFYFNIFPHPDEKYEYYTWLQEIVETFPFFTTKKIAFRRMCTSTGLPRTDFLSDELSEVGGIFVHSLTLFSQTPPALKASEKMRGLGEDGEIAFFSAREGISWGSIDKELERHDNPGDVACASVRQYNRDPDVAPCVVFRRDLHWNPSDLSCCDDNMRRLSRRLAYGESGEGGPEQLQPQLRPAEVIPRIAHYMWHGGGEMDFLFYTSVLSTLYVLDLDRVYIFGDMPPSGEHWLSLQNETRLSWIYKPRSISIFGTKVNTTAHQADVAGLDLLIQFGGIHVDPDLIFNQPLHPYYWRHDAVASPSKVVPGPFPHKINIGLIMGRPQAPFWTMLVESDKNFKDELWAWNSATLLYKVWERNPETLLVCPYLQVICGAGRQRRAYLGDVLCGPRWVEEDPYFTKANANFEKWEKYVYSFHLTVITPDDLKSLDAALSGKTYWAGLARRVLVAAGRLT